MSSDQAVVAAREQAAQGRVDLGAFSSKELWRVGVEMRGVKPRPDPPPASRLPLGPRAFRQLEDPPRPILVATLADEGAEIARVQREVQLVDRWVAKVIEIREPGSPRVLSLQHLDGVLDEILTECGAWTAPAGRLSARLLVVFPLRFKWTRGKGLLPSQRWVLAKAPFPRDEVPWLDLTITTGPDSAPQASEGRADRVRTPPALPAAADADAVRAHLHAFLDVFWEVPGPGPRP